MADTDASVRFEDVTVELGGQVILDRLCFSCAPGDWLVVVGPSGCGKTTMLRAVNGLELPTSGAVHTLGSDLPGRTARQARQVWRQTGTVMQDVALFDTRSVGANVALVLRGAGRSRRAAMAEAAVWLERLGLGDKQHERPFRLSGGQRQRVALARAFAARPRLLILDEPTSALDRATACTVLAAIAELASDGTTVIMSSHRVDEVEALCSRVCALDGDRLSAVAEPPSAIVPRAKAGTPGPQPRLSPIPRR